MVPDGQSTGVPQDHERTEQRAEQHKTDHQELSVRGEQGERHQEIDEGTDSARPPPDALSGDADLDGVRDSDRIAEEDALVSHLGQQDAFQGGAEGLVPD